MKICVTGATGLLGSRLLRALTDRGDEAIVLSRGAAGASQRLGLRAVQWDPLAGAPPVEALADADAVINLAGEPVAQRWNAEVKERIRSSRVDGTANLIAGLRAAGTDRPKVLLNASAAGYYGSRGNTRLDESCSPGSDFLAQVCVAWEGAAEAAAELGVRVVRVRIGVVLDRSGGALKAMLPPFRAGVGGPVAGGDQYVPWIHIDDVVGVFLAALDGADWSGAVNAAAPEPVTNAVFSKALGRALHRPAVMPVPAIALRLLYGEMASVLTGSQRALPARTLALGYRFQHDGLDEALAAALR